MTETDAAVTNETLAHLANRLVRELQDEAIGKNHIPVASLAPVVNRVFQAECPAASIDVTEGAGQERRTQWLWRMVTDRFEHLIQDKPAHERDKEAFPRFVLPPLFEAIQSLAGERIVDEAEIWFQEEADRIGAEDPMALFKETQEANERVNRLLMRTAQGWQEPDRQLEWIHDLIRQRLQTFGDLTQFNDESPEVLLPRRAFYAILRNLFAPLWRMGHQTLKDTYGGDAAQAASVLRRVVGD